MPITAQEYGKACVLKLGQDLAGDEPQQLRASVTDLIDRVQTIDFVIDFEGCTFIDSQGLEAMLFVKKKAEQLFGRVKLINLDENCRKILEIVRLEPKFEQCHDLAAALKMMG